MILRLLIVLACLGSFATELVFDSSTAFVRVSATTGGDSLGSTTPAHAAVPVVFETFVTFVPVLRHFAVPETTYAGPVRAPEHRPPIRLS